MFSDVKLCVNLSLFFFPTGFAIRFRQKYMRFVQTQPLCGFYVYQPLFLFPIRFFFFFAVRFRQEYEFTKLASIRFVVEVYPIHTKATIMFCKKYCFVSSKLRPRHFNEHVMCTERNQASKAKSVIGKAN